MPFSSSRKSWRVYRKRMSDLTGPKLRLSSSCETVGVQYRRIIVKGLPHDCWTRSRPVEVKKGLNIPQKPLECGRMHGWNQNVEGDSLP